MMKTMYRLKKIFANYTWDKGLVASSKEPSQSVKKIPNNPMGTWVNKGEKFTEENKLMENKHMTG